jgi:hypothetical protein
VPNFEETPLAIEHAKAFGRGFARGPDDNRRVCPDGSGEHNVAGVTKGPGHLLAEVRVNDDQSASFLAGLQRDIAQFRALDRCDGRRQGLIRPAKGNVRSARKHRQGEQYARRDEQRGDCPPVARKQPHAGQHRDDESGDDQLVVVRAGAVDTRPIDHERFGDEGRRHKGGEPPARITPIDSADFAQRTRQFAAGEDGERQRDGSERRGVARWAGRDHPGEGNSRPREQRYVRR